VGRIPGEALDEAVKEFAAQVLAGGDAGLYALKADGAPQLLLFLWASDNGRRWGGLSFPTLGKKALLSRYGMAVLEEVEIAELEGQELQLFPLEPQSLPQTRIEMINRAL